MLWLRILVRSVQHDLYCSCTMPFRFEDSLTNTQPFITTTTAALCTLTVSDAHFVVMEWVALVQLWLRTDVWEWGLLRHRLWTGVCTPTAPGMSVLPATQCCIPPSIALVWPVTDTSNGLFKPEIKFYRWDLPIGLLGVCQEHMKNTLLGLLPTGKRLCLELSPWEGEKIPVWSFLCPTNTQLFLPYGTCVVFLQVCNSGVQC